MARLLSKSRLTAFRQCPKRLWLQVHRPELAAADGSAAGRFASGHRVGEIARELRPGGELVGSGDDIARAVHETQQLLAAPGDRILFEPAVASGDVVVRADILERWNGRYRLVEVKSASSAKEHHVDDVAIQAWVLRGAGLPVDNVALAHVDSSFVYAGDGDYRGLFREEPLDEQIAPLMDAIPRWVDEAQRVLAGTVPVIGVGRQCSQPYECEFGAACRRDEPEYPVSILSRSGKFAAVLSAEGFRDIRDVPEARLVKPAHLTIWRATRSGQAEIDASVGSVLRSLPYPRAYLDFETIAPAVPIWAGTRPYQRIPVQWSCHIQDATGAIAHRRALIATGADPRRAFAQSLIEAVPPDGPVFAYNAPFEAGVLGELGVPLAEFADPLRRIADRLVDLLLITRDHYYHPAMKGSWSLKAVLPTVAPDLDYAKLGGAVQSGSDVESVYAEIINPATAPDCRRALESALHKYCERDTLALVRLVGFFEGQESH